MKKLTEMIFFNKQNKGSKLLIGSSYSEKREHPTLKVVRPHKGVDLNLKNEEDLDAELVAIANGKVVWRTPMSGYGNLIVVEYINKKLEKINILYAHLNRYHKDVKMGSVVKKRRCNWFLRSVRRDKYWTPFTFRGYSWKIYRIQRGQKIQPGRI